MCLIHRVTKCLIMFSCCGLISYSRQFLFCLNIIEDYLKWRGYKMERYGLSSLRKFSGFISLLFFGCLFDTCVAIYSVRIDGSITGMFAFYCSTTNLPTHVREFLIGAARQASMDRYNAKVKPYSTDNSVTIPSDRGAPVC